VSDVVPTCQRQRNCASPTQLAKLLSPELSEPEFESALARVHQRFFDQHLPACRWLIVPDDPHNAESNNTAARRRQLDGGAAASLHSKLYGNDIIRWLWVPISYEASPHRLLRHGLEFRVQGGYSLPHPVMI